MHKKYGNLYRRATGVDLSKCVYCGGGRQALDHVPAISLLDDIDVRMYIKAGGKFTLYPVCTSCNFNLGRCALIDYYERLQYLSRKYEAKLSKFESWTPYEVSQMGPNMQSFINASAGKIAKYQTLLNGVESKILAVELGEIIL